MKILPSILFAFALIVGVAIGYMFNPSVEIPSEKPVVKSPGALPDAGANASVQALRERIAELEAKLAARDGASEKSVEKAVEKSGAGWGGLSPKEWREKMKREKPEQYVQMTNSFARWRAERLSRAQQKVDFLASLDVSKMSASARKTHAELQELIARREELEQKMHDREESDEGLTREDRAALWREMHQIDQQIREHNARERENLIVEAAKNLGFQGQDAADVAETFQEIIENTEGGFNTTGRPGRGPGGPGGGFPPPPGR